MIAVFRCRHQSTEAFYNWLINGIPAGQFSDIITSSTNGNGTPVYTLTIPATLEYNGTEVVCVAFIDGSPLVSERTPPVMLTIVGGMLMSLGHIYNYVGTMHSGRSDHGLTN